MALTIRLWRLTSPNCLLTSKKLPLCHCQSVKALLVSFKSVSFSSASMQQLKNLNFIRTPTTILLPIFTQSVRNFTISAVCRSGGRMFNIHPSMYTNRRVVTWTLFYCWLALFIGGIPCLYLNITEGNAELTDIPEGYIPHEWEYYKKPLQRWFSRNLATSEQRNLETSLGGLEIRKESTWADRRNGRAYEIMRERRDYHGWFTTQFTRFRYNEWVHDMAYEFNIEMKNPLMFQGEARME